MNEVKVAGLTSNSEFEAEKVKEHIKQLAVSAVDVSGFAKKEVVDSITQKIESGELNGEPGEVVGVFGETDATLVDGALTIDPNHAVVKVPQISGVVIVNIEDVNLPEGVSSANGVQVTLLMDGVDEDSTISWPVGTITHDTPVPGKHVALLMRTEDHWEVYYPPVTSSSVDSDVLFSEEYPVLRNEEYDPETNSMQATDIIPIQEQISGSVYDYRNDYTIHYGKRDGTGLPTTISGMIQRLWGEIGQSMYRIENTGKTVVDIHYRRYDEEENFVFPDPSLQDGYTGNKTALRPSTTVKEINGTPHLVHWMPKWSENMAKVIRGEMTNREFADQFVQFPKPSEPGPTYQPDPNNPGETIYVWPTSEELDAYNNNLKEWTNTWEVTPIGWEAYTVPMTRDESLDYGQDSLDDSSQPPVPA